MVLVFPRMGWGWPHTSWPQFIGLHHKVGRGAYPKASILTRGWWFAVTFSLQSWWLGIGFCVLIFLSILTDFLSQEKLTKQFAKIQFLKLTKTIGQLISKRFWGTSISSKKRTNKFDFTTMIPQVDLFSFVFWKNWRLQKTISKLTDLYLPS